MTEVRDTTTPAARGTQPTVRTYAPPEFQVYGDMREITRGNGSSGPVSDSPTPYVS